MTDKQFVKGLNAKTVKTKYGEIIKIGIEIDDFCNNNPINERGYINFELLKSKNTGNWYAEINNYKKNDKNTNNNDTIVQFNDEEIPF